MEKWVTRSGVAPHTPYPTTQRMRQPRPSQPLSPMETESRSPVDILKTHSRERLFLYPDLWTQKDDKETGQENGKERPQ